jgi:pyruvate dehydrogenase E2 component (dihydrolipoamide acetyltransferase)
VTGTGPDGIITEKDVRAACDAAKAAPAPALQSAAEGGSAAGADEIIPMEGIRRLIADNMLASLQSAAQLSVFVECDVTEMVLLRQTMLERNKKVADYRLSYNDIIAYAVCRALLRHPIMNSTLQEDGIHLHRHVNLGIAVSLDTGLIVPNVNNADTFTLEELKNKVRDSAARARKGGLGLEEISGGTFTISNVSMMGVDGFTPILNPPETAILGVGRVVEKAAAHQGQVRVRQMMTLSLTFNHMVTDGGPAMAFLRALADMLENPATMLC